MIDGTGDFIAHGMRFILALVFLTSGVAKLLARHEFARALRDYHVLPAILVSPVARWLPRVEVALSLILLAGIALRPASAAAGVLLVGFVAAIGVNLVRGRNIACGCYGFASSSIGWHVVVRNVLLITLAALVFYEAPSALTFESPDAPASGVAVAALIVAAICVLGEQVAAETLHIKQAHQEFRRAATGVPRHE